MPITPTGSSCISVLSFEQTLAISATLTLTVFDEGLPGAPAGHFSPFPFDPFFEGTIDAGYEWAAASVLVGRQVDPRDADPFLAYTFQAATLRTAQDSIPEHLTLTTTLVGQASLEGLFSQEAELGVQQVAAWVSGIPEPETYILLLAGLLLLAAVSRRRASRVIAQGVNPQT